VLKIFPIYHHLNAVKPIKNVPGYQLLELFLCGNLRQRALEIKLDLLSESLRDRSWVQVRHLLLLKYSLFFLFIHTRIIFLSMRPRVVEQILKLDRIHALPAVAPSG
jgi:hypothetical protein